MNISLDKRIIDMTLGELLQALNELQVQPSNVFEPDKNKEYAYGLAGLAGVIGCSVTTAHRIKKSGKLNSAIIQVGRKIVIDVNKAMELLITHKN